MGRLKRREQKGDAMSKTLASIISHWNGKMPTEGCVNLPFDLESFCRENDAALEALKAIVDVCPKAQDEYNTCWGDCQACYARDCADIAKKALAKLQEAHQ